MTYRRFYLQSAILFTVLTLMSSVAFAETPDECAARLDLDIRVTTFAEATAWYEQVLRECAPEEGAGEGMTRLTIEELQTLANTNCSIVYFEARTMDDVLILPRLFDGSMKLHWRHDIAGDWQELQAGELQILTGGGVSDQFTPFWIPIDEPIIGAGVHQFELRTRAGADKFEIMETWGALYLVDINC